MPVKLRSRRRRARKTRTGAQPLVRLTRPGAVRRRRQRRSLPLLTSPGALSVSAPVAIGRVRVAERPRMSTFPNGDCLISHREYVADILGIGASTFGSSAYSVNPGLPQTFPWLSSVASNFESYQFTRLAFEYETDISTATAGTAILAVDFDASDAAPTTKSQVMSYRGAVRSPVWQPCRYVANTEDIAKLRTHYVRRGALAANQDIKMYDVGTLFACTVSAAATIGELYVEYTVKLITPHLGSVGIGNALYASYTGASNLAPFVVGGTSNAPLTLVSTGTTTSVTTFTAMAAYNCVFALLLGGTGITSVTWTGGTATVGSNSAVINAGATLACGYAVVVFLPGQTLILTIANTTISTQLFVGQYQA